MNIHLMKKVEILIFNLCIWYQFAGNTLWKLMIDFLKIFNGTLHMLLAILCQGNGSQVLFHKDTPV